MSFFSELGAGLRAAAKEYNDIKQEFVTIKDDVTSGVSSVKDEVTGIRDGAKQALGDSTSLLTGAAKDAVSNAKQSVSGGAQATKEAAKDVIGGDKNKIQ